MKDKGENSIIYNNNNSNFSNKINSYNSNNKCNSNNRRIRCPKTGLKLHKLLLEKKIFSWWPNKLVIRKTCKSKQCVSFNNKTKDS